MIPATFRTALVLAAFTAATAHAEEVVYVPTYEDLKAQAAAIKETMTGAPDLTANMLTHLDNLQDHTKGVESCIAIKAENSRLMYIALTGGAQLNYLDEDAESLKLKPEQNAEIHDLVRPEAKKLADAMHAGFRAEHEAPQCL